MPRGLDGGNPLHGREERQRQGDTMQSVPFFIWSSKTHTQSIGQGGLGSIGRCGPFCLNRKVRSPGSRECETRFAKVDKCGGLLCNKNEKETSLTFFQLFPHHMGRTCSLLLVSQGCSTTACFFVRRIAESRFCHCSTDTPPLKNLSCVIPCMHVVDPCKKTVS